MLSFQMPGVRLCDRISRREILRVGGLGVGGLTLPQLLASQQAQADGSGRGRAKSCIVLFLLGGAPQHSTWDPKPDAPAEVRGEIAPIATSVPGVHFGELMPELAKRADQLAVLRAVSTGDNAHSSSGYYMLTGRPHVPMNQENANPGPPNDWPNWGSVLHRLVDSGSALPASVRLPCHIFNTDGSIWPGQDAGFLGRARDPWLFRCQPASPDYRITEFQLPSDVPLARLSARRDLLDTLGRQLGAAAEAPRAKHFDELSHRAYGVLSSAASGGAFDLAAEPEPIRSRYGMSQFGQSCLLARRLVEAGVRLVQVNWYRGPEEPSDAPCWDSHVGETARLKSVLIPPLDSGFSALLDDLRDRGMLEDTLVVCMAEFGRTPRMNGRGGRDHWGPVFSIAMAGGGIRGGVVHGASDPMGAYPRNGLVKPEDITATIFHSLGFSPGTEYHDLQGRAFPVSRGEVIQSVLS